MNLIMARLIRQMELEVLLRVSNLSYMTGFIYEVPVMRQLESGEAGEKSSDAHTQVRSGQQNKFDPQAALPQSFET